MTWTEQKLLSLANDLIRQSNQTIIEYREQRMLLFEIGSQIMDIIDMGKAISDLDSAADRLNQAPHPSDTYDPI